MENCICETVMGQLPREAKATNNIQQHKKEAKNGQGKGEKRGTPKEAQKATEEKKSRKQKAGKRQHGKTRREKTANQTQKQGRKPARQELTMARKRKNPQNQDKKQKEREQRVRWGDQVLIYQGRPTI